MTLRLPWERPHAFSILLAWFSRPQFRVLNSLKDKEWASVEMMRRRVKRSVNFFTDLSGPFFPGLEFKINAKGGEVRAGESCLK